MFAMFKSSPRLILMSCTAVLLLSGCGERKPMSPEENWQRFCYTYEDAAYNIMSDRQHQITEKQALEHIEKIQAGVERDMLEQLVKQAHQTPAFVQQVDKEKAMDDFKAGKYQACMAKMPKSANTTAEATQKETTPTASASNSTNAPDSSKTLSKTSS